MELLQCKDLLQPQLYLTLEHHLKCISVFSALGAVKEKGEFHLNLKTTRSAFQQVFHLNTHKRW